MLSRTLSALTFTFTLAGCVELLGDREPPHISDAGPPVRDATTHVGDASPVLPDAYVPPDAHVPPDGALGPQPFLKHGNNGTQSCASFCGNPQFGTPTSCLGSALTDFPCSMPIGGLPHGTQQLCTCDNDGIVYSKPGDDGTASCNLYCSGAQWGEVGSCVSSTLSSNASIEIAGSVFAYDTDCAIEPGLIVNAQELTCVCE